MGYSLRQASLTVPEELRTQLQETSARVHRSLLAMTIDPDYREWHAETALQLQRGVVPQGLTVQYTDPVLGQALFARRDIAEGELLGEYTGVVIPATRVGEALAPYAASLFPSGLSLPPWERLRVDATDPIHLFRHVNHLGSHTPIRYSDGREENGPNVGFFPCFVAPNFHLAVVCLRPIREGDELRADYGDGYFATSSTPSPISRVYHLGRSGPRPLGSGSMEDQ